MHRHRNEAAAAIAAKQHGLITRDQALMVGFDASAIQRERTSGRWQTVARGVYLVAGAPFTWHTNLLRTCLGLRGVASHRSGAVQLEAGGFRPGAVEVTVRNGAKPQGAGARVHEALDFDLIRPVTIKAIPTTPPARLGVDLGSVVPFPAYVRTMDQLIGRGALTWPDLFDSLVLHAQRGRNGVGALRTYLRENYGSTIEESPFEQWIQRQLQARSFPKPTTQLTILDDGGTFLARVDAAYEAERIIIEVDSIEWHLNRRSFTRDPVVRRRLRMLGWFVFEITWDMATKDPDGTFADLRELLTRRAPLAEGSTEPSSSIAVPTSSLDVVERALILPWGQQP
jgi:hypothetical protein